MDKHIRIEKTWSKNINKTKDRAIIGNSKHLCKQATAVTTEQKNKQTKNWMAS